jgi:hypothetical protein
MPSGGLPKPNKKRGGFGGLHKKQAIGTKANAEAKAKAKANAKAKAKAKAKPQAKTKTKTAAGKKLPLKAAPSPRESAAEIESLAQAGTPTRKTPARGKERVTWSALAIRLVCPRDSHWLVALSHSVQRRSPSSCS